MFKFEKLIAWQKGVALVDRLFEIADRFPRQYQSSLGDQLRRAALSITNNLAEGNGRRTAANRRLYYDHAKGSVYEVVSVLAVAKPRGAIAPETHRSLYESADELAAIISGLMQAASGKQGQVFREEAAAYESELNDH